MPWWIFDHTWTIACESTNTWGTSGWRTSSRSRVCEFAWTHLKAGGNGNSLRFLFPVLLKPWKKLWVFVSKLCSLRACAWNRTEENTSWGFSDIGHKMVLIEIVWNCDTRIHTLLYTTFTCRQQLWSQHCGCSRLFYIFDSWVQCSTAVLSSAHLTLRAPNPSSEELRPSALPKGQRDFGQKLKLTNPVLTLFAAQYADSWDQSFDTGTSWIQPSLSRYSKFKSLKFFVQRKSEASNIEWWLCAHRCCRKGHAFIP